MSVAEIIRRKLEAAFGPARIEVRDESHLHKGHAGAREGGESHFRVTIVSTAFEGMSRIARQRAVNTALKDELAGPVHALAMTALTPCEDGAQR
ncbi:MAG: BolA/IbaG family iron-sulfur metabolism protein [Alphaproteobacteria bacterium]|nr:BolA/IbaG family iron-sulfur metabolism protein [Alphaproteobacteria bacterium]